jgi:hypothetical protein
MVNIWSLTSDDSVLIASSRKLFIQIPLDRAFSSDYSNSPDSAPPSDFADGVLVESKIRERLESTKVVYRSQKSIFDLI